jgi:hypothetical protein
VISDEIIPLLRSVSEDAGIKLQGTVATLAFLQSDALTTWLDFVHKKIIPDPPSAITCRSFAHPLPMIDFFAEFPDPTLSGGVTI